jgi:hypothetical protein
MTPGINTFSQKIKPRSNNVSAIILRAAQPIWIMNIGSRDAIGMATPDGKHYYQNEASDKIFGDVGNDPPMTLYVNERVGREVFRTIKAGGEWKGEVTMYGRGKKVLDILLRAYAVKDHAAPCALS